MKQFTNLYQVAKTLRFELIPDERTKDFLEHSDLIAQDEHRAESYKLVKKIIDRYHKKFITEVLSSVKLQYAKSGKLDSLEEFYSLYTTSQKTDADKKALEKVQEHLRKQIVDSLTKDSRFKRIDKKELIREDIMKVIEPEEKNLIDEFRDFTTYFTGFHENRKNMYSAEAQSTAIAYRLIHENLPKFIDNIGIFQKILHSPVADHLPLLYKEMEEYLNMNNIEEMFMLDYYSDVLTQEQIEVYNGIIGGRTKESDEKIQGINEYVNRYNQQPENHDNRLPKLKPLFKQILSDREAISWIAEEFKSDKELLEAVKTFYEELKEDTLPQLKVILSDIEDYNLDGIFIPNDIALTDISQALFGDWGTIKKAIIEDLKQQCPPKKNEKTEKYEKRIAKLIKSADSFSISYLNSCIGGNKNICSHFMSLGAVNKEYKQTENIFLQIENAYTEAQELLAKDCPANYNLAQDKPNVTRLKTFLDAIKSLQHFVKPLLGAGSEAEKDERFYGEMAVLWEELNQITPLYNKVRNRMTRKPYSLEKFKLNFNIKGNFLGGWVDSKTEKSDNGTQYDGYLFRKINGIGEYDYYLGVSANTKLFRRKENAKGSFERLDYYQPKSQTVYGNSYVGKNSYEEDKQELMKTILAFVSSSNHNELLEQISLKDTPSAMLNLIKVYSTQVYDSLLKDQRFSKINSTVTDNLHNTILAMNRIPKAEKYRNASFTIFTEPQQVIDEICKEKVFTYFVIDDQEMDEAIGNINKPFFLFKISNKDLAYADKYCQGLRKSRGTENLHTMYFKALMGGNQNCFDIGTGEMFFRRSSIKVTKPTHPAQIPIKRKSREGSITFGYDIIKDKRFTVDKFSFHLSIVLNYQCPGKADINGLTKQYIKDNDDLHFIGIDRGERHLIYVSLIDSKGRIKDQFSLNSISNEHNGDTYQTNYRDLLEKREDDRQKERQSWNSIESIKELKQGYLSQVIHKIVTMMVENHAVIVLEDLNMGFKRGRQKVESSVYQQFEKALIEKLNYLVDKHLSPQEEGGLLHAYQLTNKFTSFRDMRKQNGFLFYIPAWNTSKIDPMTGFVNMLHPKYESIEKARAFFCKFQSIRYNQAKDWYEFAFDYNDFTTQAEGTRTKWTLCTHGTRVETFRNPEKNNNLDNKDISLTEAFHTLFKDYAIRPEANLKEAIANQTERKFFERLIHLLNLTLQMRNSVTDTDIDYMISPVADENGVFYDSRTCGKALPENADANGAYNIARKGLWIARQIKTAENIEKIDLVMSKKEWLDFAQTKPYLKD